MRLLLDTHLLVLAIGSPERLPAALGPARWPAADHGRPATGGLPGADAAAAKPVAGRDASHCSAGSLALDLAVPPFQPSFPASHRSGSARPSGAPDPATGPSARAHPQGTGGRDHPAATPWRPLRLGARPEHWSTAESCGAAGVAAGEEVPGAGSPVLPCHAARPSCDWQQPRRSSRPTRLAKLAPKRWMDASLAAFAISSGTRLISLEKGFRPFLEEGLDLMLLEADWDAGRRRSPCP